MASNKAGFLKSYNCFSSWERRDDIIGQTEVDGNYYYENRRPLDARDGFYCPFTNGYHYHTSKLPENEAGWFQVDLMGFYSLKCVRVSTRSIEEYPLSYFKDVEFRFGNETIGGDTSLNHIIGFAAGHIEGVVEEHCLDYPLVGRYLNLKEYGDFRKFSFGEIQVTIR